MRAPWRMHKTCMTFPRAVEIMHVENSCCPSCMTFSRKPEAAVKLDRGEVRDATRQVTPITAKLCHGGGGASVCDGAEALELRETVLDCSHRIGGQAGAEPTVEVLDLRALACDQLDCRQCIEIRVDASSRLEGRARDSECTHTRGL